VDFYIRVFVRVYTKPAEVKRSLTKHAYVYQSTQCPSFYLQSVGAVGDEKKGTFKPSQVTAPTTCPETGGAMKIGGPIWSAPIHDQEVVDELLRRVSSPDDKECMPFPAATRPRMESVLRAISEEVKDAPLYYTIPDLASTLRVHNPKFEQVCFCFSF
jgi:tRNA (guanine26-N2/guanine27-N2)-dimethyltransferase